MKGCIYRWLIALICVGLLGSVMACDLDEEFSTPRPGDQCEEEGATSEELTCVDGIWVREDGEDAGQEDTGDEDASHDACVHESDEEFCARFELECGEAAGDDNCGEDRVVDCDEFEDHGCDGLEECLLADSDEDVEENHCACPELDDPEAELCDMAQADCGTLVPGELCADWEGGDDVDCGSCPDDEQECGQIEANQCACPCEIDGDCYADGDVSPDNECQVCDSDVANDEFSAIDDGNSCEADIDGAEGSCEEGSCIEECPDGYTLCEEEGICVDLDSDDDHCDACGEACGEDEVCDGGSCVDSDSG